MRYYCTYFDKNYFTRGLAMLESLAFHSSNSVTVFVLCHDELTRLLLSKLHLDYVVPLSLAEIELRNPELLRIKQGRSLVEYYWTLTPTLLLVLLEKYQALGDLCYVDADLYFYSDPEVIYDEMGTGSVLVHEHRYSMDLEGLESVCGRFNVGLLQFKQDESGLAVLRWWRDRCNEWCYEIPENGKLGDQKYLDQWPVLFPQLRVIKNPGAGLAPWNHAGHRLTSLNDNLWEVDGDLLIFYHYHSFVVAGKGRYVPTKHPHYPLSEKLLRIFVPYSLALERSLCLVRQICPDFNFGHDLKTPLSGEVTLLLNEAGHYTEPGFSLLHENWAYRWGSKQSLVSQIDAKNSKLLNRWLPREGERLLSTVSRQPEARLCRVVYVIGANDFREGDDYFRFFPNIENLYLFEPLPDLYDFLVKKYAGDERVKVFPYAIAEADREAMFHVSNNKESSSLMPFALHEKVFPGIRETEQILVSVRSVASLRQEYNIPKPDFLLIDVQGAEHNVLQGLDQDSLENLYCFITEASKVEMYEGGVGLDVIKDYLAPLYSMAAFVDMLNTKIHGDALFVNMRRLQQRAKAEVISQEAEIAYARGETKEAVRLLQDAMLRDGGIAVVHNNLGAICLREGMIDAATGFLEEAVRLAPNDGSVIRNYVELLLINKDVESAVGLVKSYLSSNPSDIAVAEMVGIDPEPFRRFKVTAIVSTYSSGEFIAECLDDLLAQSIADQIEIIVVDAASPENEGEVVAKYLAEGVVNLRYIRLDDRIGIYAAWNMAIKEARGDYLISCSTNDRLRKDACERLSLELDENPEVALAYGDSYITAIPHQSFERHSLSGVMAWPEYSHADLLVNCRVGPHPMWRRSLHEKLGYFDETYLAIADQDMWLRIADHYRLKHVSFVTGLYWQTSESLSGDARRAAPEVASIHYKHQFLNKHRDWLVNHSPTEIEIDGYAERYFARGNTVRFDLIVVVHEGDVLLLQNTLDSLKNGLGISWRLVVVSSHLLEHSLFGDSEKCCFVHVPTLEDDFLLSTIISNVLSNSDAPYLAVLPVGVLFEPHALIKIEDCFDKEVSWGCLYTDHDFIGFNNNSIDPFLKPDFDQFYLLCFDYIGQALFFRQQSLRDIGGVSPSLGAELFDSVFRLFENSGRTAVGHIADVLLHFPSSRRFEDACLQNAARRVVVEQHLYRMGFKATVENSLVDGVRNITFTPSLSPLVSVVIMNRDQYSYLRACVESLLSKTTYQLFDIVIVDNGSRDPDVMNYYDALSERLGDRFQWVEYNSNFNYSAQVNLAASVAKGSYLLLLDNDVEVVQPDWMARLVSLALFSNISVVGARLLYPETGEIQHAGFDIGGAEIDSFVKTPYQGWHSRFSGYLNDLVVIRRRLLSSACMLVKKSVFDALSGFDTDHFPVYYGDVDFCLRVRAYGHEVVHHPDSVLVHHGGASYKFFKSDVCGYGNSHGHYQMMTERNYLYKNWLDCLYSLGFFNNSLDMVNSLPFPDFLASPWGGGIVNKPRIIAPSFPGGSGKYRVDLPLALLRSSGCAHSQVMQVVNDSNIRLPTLMELERDQCDALLLHTPLSDGHLDALRLYAKHKSGMKIIISVDDLVSHIPEWSSAYVKQQRYFRDARRRLREGLSFADRLIVSTQPLADEFHSMCNNTIIVPNYLRRSDWGGMQSPPRVLAGRRPRVGWVGAGQHQGDLALITDVVRATHKYVDWVFMGMWPEDVVDFIKEKHAGVKFDVYPTAMSKLALDLAIAPLEDNKFNACKSNLRILEYGAMGWPVICSDVFPYRTNDAPVCRLNNDPEAWIDAIMERVSYPDVLIEDGQKLNTWVNEHYWLEDHLNEWVDALLL